MTGQARKQKENLVVRAQIQAPSLQQGGILHLDPTAPSVGAKLLGNFGNQQTLLRLEEAVSSMCRWEKTGKKMLLQQ